MHQLEELIQQLRAHLTLESERIEKLKDFSAALEISRSGSGATTQLSQIEYPVHGRSDVVPVCENSRQTTQSRDICIERPPHNGDRNLWSTLGQYQIIRDELVRERRREYQEHLKQQKENLEQKKSDLFSAGTGRDFIVLKCKDRNELDEERRKEEERKYREELKQQIEDNRARKEKQREMEIQAQKQYEIRLQKELRKFSQNQKSSREDYSNKSVTHHDVVVNSKVDDRIRSPSYLHVKERMNVSTPIKLRPLVESFSRSTYSEAPKSIVNIPNVAEEVISNKNSGSLSQMPQVKNKMLRDAQQLMNKLQSDLNRS